MNTRASSRDGAAPAPILTGWVAYCAAAQAENEKAFAQHHLNSGSAAMTAQERDNASRRN